MQIAAMSPPNLDDSTKKTEHTQKKTDHNRSMELKNTFSSLEATNHSSIFLENNDSTSPDSRKSRLVERMNKSDESVENSRDRLKRHRVEVAGRVWIPDMWEQDDLLKDWIDCTAFDASLMNSSIISARDALVAQARRIPANSATVSRALRLENSF